MQLQGKTAIVTGTESGRSSRDVTFTACRARPSQIDPRRSFDAPVQRRMQMVLTDAASPTLAGHLQRTI